MNRARQGLVRVKLGEHIGRGPGPAPKRSGHALNDVADGLPDLGWCSKGDVAQKQSSATPC